MYDVIRYKVKGNDREKLLQVQKMLKRKSMSDTLKHLVNLAHRRLTEEG